MSRAVYTLAYILQEYPLRYVSLAFSNVIPNVTRHYAYSSIVLFAFAFAFAVLLPSSSG